MKIQLHKQHHRCSTIMAASVGAIILCAAHSASAQLLTNIFSGANTPGATSVSTNPSIVNVLGTNTATIGPGFTTTVALTAGVADTLTTTINPSTTTVTGAPGALTISETSAVGVGVVDVGGTFTVDKTFTGVSLAANTPYEFTLLKTQATQVSALNGLQLTFTAGTTVVNTTNLLTVLGGNGNNTFTVDFTTPANLSPTGPLELTLSGMTTAGVLSGPLVFSGGNLNMVPEPGTWAMLAAGLGVLLVTQRFRFSALVR